MLKITCYFVCFLVCYSGAAYVDTLNKCAIKDQECLRNLYQNIIHGIGNKGVPELGIPPVDPMEIENLVISFFGAVNLTLVKGVVTGVSNCVFDSFTVDLDKGSGTQENTCSVEFDGQYKIASSGFISSILGVNGIHGEGNAKATIDNVHLSFDYPAYAQKRDDGEIYIKVDYKNIKYEYKIRGGVKISADNLYLGDVEASKTIIPLFNQNWEFLLRAFGKPVLDKAVEIYFDFAGKFFEKVPTKYYIIDDLNSIARP